MDIKDTNTTGNHTFIVALRLGGMTGEPEVSYKDYQYIRADSESAAVTKYNRLNNCSYFYGDVIRRL